MALFKLAGTDVSDKVAALKVGYETMVSDKSGRNARGDMTVDIIGRKVKIFCTFRPMSAAEMQALMALLSAYVVQVTFLDPKTGAEATKKCYTSTPEPQYLRAGSGPLFDKIDVNFIEL